MRTNHGSFFREWSFLLFGLLLLVFISVPKAQAASVPDSYTELQLDAEFEAVIEDYGSVVYFSFVPDESDTYIFRSIESSSEVQGALLDENGNQLVSDCGVDSDYIRDFNIQYYLEKGHRYYFRAAYYYDYHMGAFSVILQKKTMTIEVSDYYTPVDCCHTSISSDGRISKYYDYFHALEIKVTTSDGREYSGKAVSVADELGEYSTTFYVDQSQWDVGVHTDYLLFGNQRIPFTVVLDPPFVQSIEVEDVFLTEDQKTLFGIWNEEVQRYVFTPGYQLYPNITIKTSRGKTYSDDMWAVMNQIHEDFGEYYHFSYDISGYDFSDVQDIKPGEYSASLQYMTQEIPYKITIAPGIIESVTAQDVYYQHGSRPYDDSTPTMIHVRTKAGKEYDGDFWDILNKLHEDEGIRVCAAEEFFPGREYKYLDEWPLGTYEMGLYLGNHKVRYHYHVISSEEVIIPPENSDLKQAVGIADELADIVMEAAKKEDGITDAEKEGIASALGSTAGYELIASFDINIYSQQIDANGAAIPNSRRDITQLDTAVRLGFFTPQGDNKVYQVVRAHFNSNNALEYTLLDVVENGNGLIFVESDKFSTYYLVETEIISCLPGDVNNDGQVNLLDLVRLCKFLAGYNVIIREQNSDVNGDGAITLLDLVRLCKYLAGYDVVLE